MTYPRCDSKRRVLPVVTFVLISYLFGSELVCARPQDNFSSKSPDNDTKEIVADKVEPINNSTLNDRYKSKLNQRQREIMFYYLKHFESNCLSAYSLGDLNQATNDSKLTVFDGVLQRMNQNNKKITLYFKKIKTKIKNTSLKSLMSNDELWASFKQIKSKRDFFSNHFKLLIIILFLKLFTIFKSIKLQHCANFKIKNDFKFKNQNKIHDILGECRNYEEIAFYTERIIDTSFDSLNSLKRNKKCTNMINNLQNVYENNPKNYKKTRVKRNTENNTELTYTDFDKMTIDERNEYVDNFYREKLIHNFLENSLPDLRNNAGDFMIPVPVDETQDAAEKTIPSTKSPYFVVESMNSFVLPKPNVHTHISSSIEITTSSPSWNLQSTTDMYPVYLITNKPKPYKPTTIINSVQSQAVTDSNILLTSNSYLSSSINWIPSNSHDSPNYQSSLHSQMISSSTYGPPDYGNWQYIRPYEPGSVPILQDKDPPLQFPYDVSASPTPPTANEPIFVEPIVVSSVDQLPTNYPIPLENSSLGHNPVTVLVGSRPPEIVLLEDVTFQSVHTIYQDPEQETLNQAPGAAAEDPPMAAAAPAGAAAAPPVAAAPAGGGGGGGAAAAAVAGTLLSAGAGSAATILGGAATAAAGGAATALGAGGGSASGFGQEQSLGTGLGTALDTTESDEEYDDWYQELTESVMTIFSFRFIRQTLMALYSLVMPHISFMLTSAFTVIAFLFPWLYPHIVVPLVSLMSSFTSRFL